MTLGTMVLIIILGTQVHIITLGTQVGLGALAIIPALGTGDHLGVITTATGAGAEEAGTVDIGDIHLRVMDIIGVDMLLPLQLAEADGQPQTMLTDVRTTDLLLMVQQTMVAEAEISIAELVA